MTDYRHQNPSWADYLGDTLRGNVPINQLVPQHPYILDTLGLAEVFEKNTQHIMLLTLDEAQGVVDDLLNSHSMKLATTYAGNIKDGIAGTKDILNRVHYVDVGKIIHRLKALGIKAIQYNYKGLIYVKITGYASLRRILQATRFKINPPRVLELGIGKSVINAGIIEGARFCIWFSFAYHTIEYIFKSDHDVAVFIGNITMDVAKIIVTIFVADFVTAIGTAIAAAASLTVPVTLSIILLVAVGFAITKGLDFLDEGYGTSDKLITAIRKGKKARQDIEQWNLEHTSPAEFAVMNTYW